MTQTLAFEKGVATMDVPTLGKTARYELAKGSLPASRPIEHYQLIENIINSASKIPGIVVTPENIFAAEGQAMRVMWQGKKDECPIENYLIQRITTRVHLKHTDDNEFNMAIGISYNEKGISMAFGSNVWVCSNQNIFGENIMHTFGGDRKVPFDKMMDIFNSWMLDFNKYRDEDYAMIERMKSREIEEYAKQLLYGKLIDKAVLQNIDTKQSAPLNQTQVADFIRASYSPEYQIPSERVATVWDLHQMGTSILKPKTSDMVTLLQNQNDFSNFIVKEFQLD